MKKIIFFGITNLLFISSIVVAQIPNPVADTEMRDGSSIRRRSIELERVKRDAVKLRPTEDSTERTIKFAEIKEDFENIQKLQSEIVKAYTTGKNINYEKIFDMFYKFFQMSKIEKQSCNKQKIDSSDVEYLKGGRCYIFT